jgi:hypothetical protein
MKNWTVISKPIKEQSAGLTKYLAYLISHTHENHVAKTTIKPILGDSNKVYKNIINSVAKREYERAKARKGGRSISSYAQSFVFTLPHSIEPKPDILEWKKISKELIKTIISFTGDDVSDLRNNIFINLHEQSNPHLNVVVSKVINEIVINELQQKSIVSALKKTFNYAVLKYLSISPSDYKPKTRRSKRYGKDFYIKNKDVIDELHAIDYLHSKNNHKDNIINKQKGRLV